VTCKAPAEEQSKMLVKLISKEPKPRAVFGEIIDESETSITLENIASGSRTTFDKWKVSEINRQISEGEVVASIGIPAFVAQKIKKIVPVSDVLGAIAKILDNKIYVTI